jgi:hypothetical protein
MTMSPRTKVAALAGLLTLLVMPLQGPGCSICNLGGQQVPTIRQELAQATARAVVIGTAQDRAGVAAASDLKITHVLRNDPLLAGRKAIELQRYLPSDPKNPPRFLVFCDVFKDKLDPFRGIPLRSAESVEYVKKVLTLDPKDVAVNLPAYFRYLENSDPEIARDAFLEFAKATDREIAQAAPRLDPVRLRAWLTDPRTPGDRLSVYALLLGACGRADDGRFLHGLLQDTTERYANAYDGILAGFMHLRPREGWDLALEVLGDSRKPLPLRLAVVRTLRFWHGAQPNETQGNVLKCLAAMIRQGELADLAVEDLRRWKIWDLTREVLEVYGRKGYDAPIMQQAIVRYALSCDDAACRSFVAERRRSDPDVVRDVEDQLRLEK